MSDPFTGAGMAGQLDPTINIILQGENRVLEEFQKIQQRAQETGQKISQVMGVSFQTSSAVVEKVYSRMAGVAKDVHTRMADGFGKVSEVFEKNIARITGVVQGVSAKMAQPMVEAYREGFRAVSRLAKESKTGQFLTQQIQRAGGAFQEYLVPPWKAGLDRMQDMAGARFQGIADRAKQALAQAGGELGGRLKDRLKLSARGGLERESGRFGLEKVAGLAQSTGSSFKQATRAAQIGARAGLDTGQIKEAVDQMQRLQKLGTPLALQQKMLQDSLGLTVKQFSAVGNAAGALAGKGGGGGLSGMLGGMMGGGAGGGLGGMIGMVGKLAGAFGVLGLAIDGVGKAFGVVKGLAMQFYGPLIAANEKLNQQIQSAATGLAATSRVIVDGMELFDPAEKIAAMKEPLRDAKLQILRDSASLVGVTSEDLSGVFTSLNTQSNQLTGQSKEMGTAIQSAAALTIDLSAAMGTLHIPLERANTEVRALLTGQDLQFSQLARQAGITKQQINMWRAQGVLVDKLREKMEPFVEGNKQAMHSIGGYTSNMNDLVQLMQRELGTPILADVVDGLQVAYNWLQGDADEGIIGGIQQIQQMIEPFLNTIIKLTKDLGAELMPLMGDLWEATKDLQPLAQILFEGFANGIVFAVKMLRPVIAEVGEFAKRIGFVAEKVAWILSLRPRSDAAQAIDIAANQTAAFSSEVKDLANSYDDLRQKREDGLDLTDDEVAREQKLRALSTETVTSIRDQIKDLEGMTVYGPEQQADRQRQIDDLKELENALVEAGLASEFQLEGAIIEEIGNDFEQLAQQTSDARLALDKLNEGGVPQELFETSKRYVGALEAQVKAGGITRQQAMEQLEEVANNVKLELGIRQQARDAIVRMRKELADQELAILKQQTASIQAEVERGSLGIVEGARQVTAAKKAELEQQIKDLEEAIREEQRLRREQIRAQVDDLTDQMAQAQGVIDSAETGAEERQATEYFNQLKARRDAAFNSLGQVSDRGLQLQNTLTTTQQQLESEFIAGNRRIQDAYKKDAAAANQGVQDQIRDVEAQVEAGTLSQVEGAQKLTELRNTELQNQVDAVTKAIADEKKLREGDDPTVREKELLAELATLEDQQRANTRRGYRDDAQARQASLDLQVKQVQQAQSELELAVREGEKNRVDAAREGTALQQEQIQLQISGIANQINAERNVRGNRGAPTQREKDLLLQQAALYNQLESVTLDGEVSLRAAQLQEIQETNSRVLDAIRLSATERELALQRRVNAAGPGGVTPEERAAEELEIRKASLQAELEAEQENIAKIKALPMPKDPTAREQVEAQIRGSIQRTTDLTLQLARLEEQAMKAAIAKEQEAQARQLRARLNQLTAERQALEAQMQLYEQILAQMQRQIDLVNEQIAAAQQLENLTQRYYARAAEFTKSEFKARKIQEEAAKLKIKQLEKQQEIERIQLELKLEQNKAMKEQAILQARIAQVQSQAAEAQAMADYAKAAADPTTRPEELEALRLGIQAAQMQGQAANFGMAMAVEDYQRHGASAAQQRGALADQQDAAMFDAQAGYARITRTQSDDRGMGTRALGLARSSARRTDEAYEAALDAVNATSTAFDDFSARLAEFSPTLGAFQQSALPQIQTPAPGLSIAGVPGAAGAGTPGMGGSNSYSFEFNNTFTGTGQPDGAAVQTFENQVLNTMKRVLDLV